MTLASDAWHYLYGYRLPCGKLVDEGDEVMGTSGFRGVVRGSDVLALFKIPRPRRL